MDKVANFFNDAENILKKIYTSFSLKQYEGFLKEAKLIIDRMQAGLMTPLNVFVTEAKSFFEKAQDIVTQFSRSEVFFFEKYKEFFSNAQMIIRSVQPNLKEFQKFCESAHLLLLNKYQYWLDFIRENTPQPPDGFERINLLKIFGISGKEEAHSKFLVWLMKEEESHGLGSMFLERFLDAVARKYPGTEKLSPEGVTIVSEASSEHGVPDIKIKGKDFLCIVENKIRAGESISKEGVPQTECYKKDAINEIKRLKIPKGRLFLIFLTPEGRRAACKDFKSMNYFEIINLLEEILQSNQNTAEDTKFLIRQFIFNLKMEILHVFDLEKRVENCLKEYLRNGEKYLWDNHEKICSLYQMLKERRNNNGRI
ncbi:PD-(D/E)XK nuclease family protein [Candidatus Calescamantes bacterium]|nr:PD-(D/E)XK nuclease family protein [Candidatus Calescamantes bacterium]